MSAQHAAFVPVSVKEKLSVGRLGHDWPEPLALDGELPAVAQMTPELLPASFRALASDISQRMQVPLDYPAIALTLCLAGAVNLRATIQPKLYDTNFVVVPNLWGGIVAPPGFLKTPVIQAATRPLNQIQTEWRQEYDAALQAFSLVSEEHELKRCAWRDQYKASAKKGTAVPSRPEEPPQQPKLRRLIVNDSTFEALHQTMSDNPVGVLVVRDELTGWWSQLDRPGREGERAFCLQAWNGDTGHTIDRIVRGTVHVDACCMSLLGGIQPGRLRSYLVDALKDGPGNDGLIQRFQLLVWPDTVTEWRNVDRAPDAAAERHAEYVFRNLLALDAENRLRFHFAPDAQELFTEWLGELEVKVRGTELHPALISHLSKYRSLMPSLALLFHLADQASSVGFDGSDFAISQKIGVELEHARKAASWCEYLESHARRVYSCVVTPQLRAARELADKIKQRKIGANGLFMPRSLSQGLEWPGYARESGTRREFLQDADWLRDVSTEPGPTGGATFLRYEVNPGVWQ